MVETFQTIGQKAGISLLPDSCQKGAIKGGYWGVSFTGQYFPCFV